MNVKDFCEKYYVNRKNSNSVKWDAVDKIFKSDNLIPMWIADMEFKGPEQIAASIIKRAEHGIYGYSLVPDSYYAELINWEKERHFFNIEKDWIRTSPGVVSALYWFVNVFTKINDSIIIFTPVYPPFYKCVTESNRKLITSNLICNENKYTIDYADFENKIAENSVKMMIFCSPHNPVGRVWKEEELIKILEICEKYNVLIISDEIHQDIVMPEHRHIPTGTVNNYKFINNIITATSASKTFNLATCLTANIIIPCPEKRKLFDDYINIACHADVNIFGITAVEAAYKYGYEWKCDLVNVIYENYTYIKKELEEFENLPIAPLEGTYLMWLDLSAYLKEEEVTQFIQEECKLAVNYGESFGEDYKCFIRLNIATHPDIIKEAIGNFKTALRKRI